MTLSLRPCLSISINYTLFDLPDNDNEIAWVQGRDGGWIIFGVCDVEGVENKQFTPFLAISLI